MAIKMYGFSQYIIIWTFTVVPIIMVKGQLGQCLPFSWCCFSWCCWGKKNHKSESASHCCGPDGNGFVQSGLMFTFMILGAQNWVRGFFSTSDLKSLSFNLWWCDGGRLITHLQKNHISTKKPFSFTALNNHFTKGAVLWQTKVEFPLPWKPWKINVQQFSPGKCLETETKLGVLENISSLLLLSASWVKANDLERIDVTMWP